MTSFSRSLSSWKYPSGSMSRLSGRRPPRLYSSNGELSSSSSEYATLRSGDEKSVASVDADASSLESNRDFA